MDDTILSWTVNRAHQELCSVRGHESYLYFDEDRVYLRCVACGYESPGWEVGKHSAHLEVQPRRQPLVRLPALGARRAV